MSGWGSWMASRRSARGADLGWIRLQISEVRHHACGKLGCQEGFRAGNEVLVPRTELTDDDHAAPAVLEPAHGLRLAVGDAVYVGEHQHVVPIQRRELLLVIQEIGMAEDDWFVRDVS